MRSIRELTPALARICETCVSTVRREIVSRRAISGFERRSATRRRICISVGVSVSHPALEGLWSETP